MSKKLQPPLNVDPTHIGDPALLELFKAVQLVWEKSFKAQKTGFDIRRKAFSEFKRKSGLALVVESSKKITKLSETEAILDQSKGKDIIFFTSSNSQAYDLFRHLRNAIAHGRIEKKEIANDTYYTISDIYNNEYTMLGKIRASLLRDLVEALYKTRKKDRSQNE